MAEPIRVSVSGLAVSVRLYVFTVSSYEFSVRVSSHEFSVTVSSYDHRRVSLGAHDFPQKACACTGSGVTSESRGG